MMIWRYRSDDSGDKGLEGEKWLLGLSRSPETSLVNRRAG
jgi:hypothetical protein